MPKRLILVFAIASMVPPILRAQTPAKPQAPAQTPAKPQAPAAPAPAPAPTQAPGKPQTPAGGQAPPQAPANPQTPAQGPTKPRAAAKAKTVKPKVTMAMWNEGVEQTIGLTKQEFDSMGLAKMTQGEFLALISWASNRFEMERASARANQLTYVCGAPRKSPQDYDKVYIYVDAPDTTAPELIGGIRQDLRAIPDVQMVNSSAEADLRVSVLGFGDNVPRGRGTRFTASLTILQPCVSKLGANEFPTLVYKNHILRAGDDETELASRIVSDLNVNEVEATRRFNADLKKARAVK